MRFAPILSMLAALLAASPASASSSEGWLCGLLQGDLYASRTVTRPLKGTWDVSRDEVQQFIAKTLLPPQGWVQYNSPDSLMAHIPVPQALMGLEVAGVSFSPNHERRAADGSVELIADLVAFNGTVTHVDSDGYFTHVVVEGSGTSVVVNLTEATGFYFKAARPALIENGLIRNASWRLLPGHVDGAEDRDEKRDALSLLNGYFRGNPHWHPVEGVDILATTFIQDPQALMGRTVAGLELGRVGSNTLSPYGIRSFRGRVMRIVDMKRDESAPASKYHYVRVLLLTDEEYPTRLVDMELSAARLLYELVP